MRPSSPRAPWPLRWHLAALIACVLLPVMAFSGYVMFQLTERMRDISERRLLRTARAIAAVTDGEIWGTTRALETLAQSNPLANDDLVGFTSEARRVLRGRPTWMNVVLATPDGKQVVNLAAAPGAELGPVMDPESFHRVVATASPEVGQLTRSHTLGRLGFPVRIPVFHDGAVRYVLTAMITPDGLRSILDVPTDPDLSEVTRTVVDPHGTIVFRSKDPDRFVGTQASENFLVSTQGQGEGLFPSQTLEGAMSYVAFARSQSGWTCAMVVSREVLDGPRRRSSIALFVSGLLSVLFSIAGASIFLRRVANGMGAVTAASEALIRGEVPPASSMPIAEMDRLRQTISESARLLRERADERDRHLAQAEAAIQARDEFLSLASHELRTPLTSLQLHAKMVERELGKRNEVERSRVERFVQQTHKQVARLARLVDDMLDISRITAGKLSVQPEQGDLSAIAAEVALRMTPHLREAGCTVTVDAPESVEGRWDRYRLEQVVTNLLSNAARYGAGTPVMLTVRREGSLAELRVSDSGPGVPAEDRDRIFQKFERAAGSGKASGLGLGLFIVREITEMHGGSVRVETTPGGGATFVVTLPAAAEAQDASAA